MYFIDVDEPRDNDVKEKRHWPVRINGAPEYEEVLESSFLFDAEGSGFYRVKAPKKKAGKPVSKSTKAPLAVF